MAAHVDSKISPEQYLEIERNAEFKSEYYDGYVYAMSGASFAHGVITGNLVRALGNKVGPRGCAVIPNDLRLRISYRGFYTYPDVIVIFGKPQFVDSQHDTLINPTLLIEVLLPSTEAYDRGFKSSQYRQIESLREYALVSQKEPRIEIYQRREDGRWLLSEFAGLDAGGLLESVDCELRLGDVYQNITFEESAPR
jgi:Uma2 family endonuclease